MERFDVNTNDDLQYTFYPAGSGIVNFKVRAANDAHVALTSGPFESDPMAEVFIGGWSNTKSVIRLNRTKPDKVVVDTEGILNGDEFRGFWVRWYGGVICAGREGDAEPFISWENPEPFQISHVGVCTGWGAAGTWILEDRTEVKTEDNLTYQFHPIMSGDLEFEFKGPSNCHIALTNAGAEVDPMYEIIIGGWENQKSVIRHCRQKPDKVTVNTANIVHPGEYRKFLIQWVNGRLLVRSAEGSGDVIMEWVDDNPFPITHFGIRTAWGATGQWKICTAGSKACDRVPSAAPSAPANLSMGGGGGAGAGCWVDTTGGDLPPGALVGGQDGEEIYVGRAQHEGALIPGKVIKSHGVCYVAWGGQEHGKPEYQVLSGCNGAWVPTSGSAIPSRAIPGGETEEGEPLFIGRVQHEGTLTVGKVQASHGVCYISYGGDELGFNDYEVLVEQ